MKRLLLVVDYQKDFVDGALGFPGAEALDGPIAAKIAACRAAGDDVAFTLDTHGPDYLDTQEGRKLPVPHCLLNSEGWQLYGQTGQAMERSRDMVIGKGAFPSLWLANWLKVVAAACTAGPDPALHAKGLDVMEALQITVLNR